MLSQRTHERTFLVDKSILTWGCFRVIDPSELCKTLGGFQLIGLPSRVTAILAYSTLFRPEFLPSDSSTNKGYFLHEILNFRKPYDSRIFRGLWVIFRNSAYREEQSFWAENFIQIVMTLEGRSSSLNPLWLLHYSLGSM
jgi:hypothetical protein